MAFFGGGASVDLASPPEIGSVTPNAGNFTTVGVGAPISGSSKLSVLGTSDTSPQVIFNGAQWFGSVNGNQGVLYQGDIAGKVKVIALNQAFTAYRTLELVSDGNTFSFPSSSGTLVVSSSFSSPPAIGNTTPNTGAFTTLSANNGTITTSSPAFTLAQTWNAGAQTFTAFRVNATDTASASGSLLMDLQVGGASRLNIRKDGSIIVPNTAGQFPILSWPVNGSIECGGLIRADARFRIGAGANLQIDSGGVNTTGSYQFSASNATAAGDVVLVRDAADTLAQRRSTNAQTFRIYNTYTDASNYERGFLRWAANEFEIGAERAGTGTQRSVSILGGDNNSAIKFTANSLCAIFGNNANTFYKIIQLEAGLRYTGNDAGLFRNAAGVLEVNSGTAGTFRDLIVRNFRMSAPTGVPTTASDTGTEGSIRWDANYIYICTATNTWKRVAIATWP